MKSPSTKIKNGLLFAAIIILQLAVYFYLIFQRRIPGGVDGLQYYFVQYYFLNNVFTSGQIPHWMEYLTHGTVATWWYSISAGLLQNALLLLGDILGPLLKNLNFTSLFHWGFFIDELLLLIGSWLLGKRFFKSSLTVFFVTVSIVGSAVWMTQPWFNLHFYYAIPMVLFLFHAFLDTGKWRCFFLGGSLLAFQTLGNLMYFIPVSSFVIGLYFLIYITLNYRVCFEKFRHIKFNYAAFLSLAGVAVSFILAYLAIAVDIEQVINCQSGRNLDGAVNPEVFLHYGGQTGLMKWTELFFGVSHYFDMTLFIGTLPVMLFLVPLIFNRDRQYIHLLAVIICLFLFSSGTYFSLLIFHIWPGMKFYRHLALVSPLIKLFLCFAAGFGFEALMEGLVTLKHKRAANLFLLLIFLFAGVGLFLFVIVQEPDLTDAFHNIITKQRIWHELEQQKGSFVYEAGLPRMPFSFEALKKIFLYIATCLVVFSGILMMFVYGRNKRWLGLLTAALIILHIAQLYTYKFQQINQRTVSLPKELHQHSGFQKMTYHKRRAEYFFLSEPKDKILSTLPFKAIYASTNLFFFKDEIGHSLQIDSWLKPLDRYMRVYWDQPMDNQLTPPKGYLSYTLLRFPLGHPASGKMAGYSEDKVQFFQKALFLKEDDLIAEAMADPFYKGDIVIIKEDASPAEAAQSDDVMMIEEQLAQDARLPLSYKVERYDSNNIIIDVDNPGNKGGWMFYSGIWHPKWRATVNGEPVKVYQANLAYKAVQLREGRNRVHFYFYSPAMRVIHIWGGINALLWLGLLLVFSFKLWFNKKICF